MKISTIFKILICSILFSVLSFDVNSKDTNKLRRKDDLPKLAVNYAFSYFLTFHPCEMNPTDTNNYVSIYLISTVKGNVKLEITSLGISREQELIPKVINEIKLIPKEAFPYLRSPTDTVMREQNFYGNAIQIRSDVPLFCYGVVKFKDRSEGFNVLSASEIGDNYQIASNNSPDQPTYVSVVGYYDNTKITFKLGGSDSCYVIKKDGDTIHKGEVLRRSLNEGDVWLIPGLGSNNDLSGSTIYATKPFAVITGNYSAGIPNKSSIKNYLIEQELPVNNWGTKYFVSPIFKRKHFSIIKIFAKNPNTQVYADGVPMWTITTPGGNSGIGYIETRAGFETPKPVLISSSEGFPINVVQFNPDDKDDDSFINIPFKMQLEPYEQFTNEVVFATPGVVGDSGFVDNFINIVYKAKSDGSIPDDLKFSEVIDGKFSWIPLNAYEINPGMPFFDDKQDVNGRKYYSKTLKLYENGIFSLKANDLFTVTMYGIGKNGAYGFPVSNTSLNLEKHDTLAPVIKFEECCCGLDHWGTIIDEPRNNTDKRSNLGLIYMDNANSYNFSFNVDPYIIGIDDSVKWILFVNDDTKNASAHLIFQDKAGNMKDTVINYITVNLKIQESKTDFGTYDSTNPPKNITKTFTLKNLSGHDLDADKFGIYIALDSKIYDYRENDINTYQDFELVDVDGKNLAPLKTDEEIKFDVKFIGDKYGSFRDSIGIVVRDIVGIVDTCSIKYFTEIKAMFVEPYIMADDYNFDKQEINTCSNAAILKITNPKTRAYYSHSPLKISGYTVEGDKVGIVGSGQIFEVEGLSDISESNPLIIQPGKDYQFKVSFRPDSARNYESRIKFIADSNIPDGISILNGIGEPTTSVNDNDKQQNFVRISPNPAKDYIEINLGAFNPTLKRGVDEGSDIQIFDILGVIVEQTPPSVQRIDISNLSPGMYFIKIGNRVKKFVKI